MNAPLAIGWASADLTPKSPVVIAGQFYARVSEGVNDPITATALVLASGDGAASESVAVFVSCDLGGIPDGLRDAVRDRIRERVPALDPTCICLHATHTHTGPICRAHAEALGLGHGDPLGVWGVALPVMAVPDYVAFAADRVADAVARAWWERAPGTAAWGLGHAVLGHNRRAVYASGESRMYGKTDDPAFRHIEGYEDHGVHLLGTWAPDGSLTGVVVNVACTAQVSEHDFTLSADFWHEARMELRRRLGSGLFVLPQCAAAGDQSPHLLLNRAAEDRMRRLGGRTEREEIGVRIADAVETVLPLIAAERSGEVRVAHRVETVTLTRRRLAEEDVREAEAEAADWRARYEAMRRELEAHPERREEPRWYKDITIAFRRMHWFGGVVERYRLEQTQPRIPVELHAVRLGDVAIVTNPFETYLDYGIRIQARSPAVQTFIVQLAGTGTYLPTERAVAGRSYGAVPASTPVGPEGGQEMVEHSLALIRSFWTQEATPDET